MGFFEPISNQLPVIYKSLTMTPNHPQGGSAALLISDQHDSPFESPLLFDFCPPGKRYGSDLEQLSGGEKSIAALSFIFALAKVRRPPLLMMDEVDAFLDAENVQSITDYMRKVSVDDSSIQSLVISHKDTLAQQSESLVGVSLLRKLATSKAYSLDLRTF